MAVLGAILAGGQSRRFGSDKALHVVDGEPLIAHAVQALRAQCDAVIVCGRQWADLPEISDYPEDGLGPLGGLLGALRFAQAEGFAEVLCLPVDTYPAPGDLLTLLERGPAAFSNQYLIGLWPAALADDLERHIAAGHRSVRSWIESSGCRLVEEGTLGLRNINRREDLP